MTEFMFLGELSLLDILSPENYSGPSSPLLLWPLLSHTSYANSMGLNLAFYLDWHTHPQFMTVEEGLSSTISLTELSPSLRTVPLFRPTTDRSRHFQRDSRNMATITVNRQ